MDIVCVCVRVCAEGAPIKHSGEHHNRKTHTYKFDIENAQCASGKGIRRRGRRGRDDGTDRTRVAHVENQRHIV